MPTKKHQIREDELMDFLKAMRSFYLTFRHLLEDDLRADGLSLPQLRLLYAVREKQGVSSAELARTCEIAPQSMQKLLERAEREKWIRRSKSATNSRIVVAELTPKGEAVLNKAKRYADQAAELMWGKISRGKIQEFQAILRDGIARAEQRRPKSPAS